jgi:hypothetical protein
MENIAVKERVVEGAPGEAAAQPPGAQLTLATNLDTRNPSNEEQNDARSRRFADLNVTILRGTTSAPRFRHQRWRAPNQLRKGKTERDSFAARRRVRLRQSARAASLDARPRHLHDLRQNPFGATARRRIPGRDADGREQSGWRSSAEPSGTSVLSPPPRVTPRREPCPSPSPSSSSGFTAWVVGDVARATSQTGGLRWQQGRLDVGGAQRATAC